MWQRRNIELFTGLKDEIEIIEIWGIGKRDKLEVYKDVGKRIKKRK